LWYIDKTFTIASTQDQFIAVPANLQQTISPMSQPTSTPQTPMRFLSVCSGMEAASVAWEPLGWKAVGFSEIEPFPCAVLAHRFPNTPNYGSLTEYQSWPLAIGDVDLLCGGTPCQSYSVAGKRGGLNDPRGQLMLSFLDLAAKLQPKWILWENVPGVLSSGQPRGADFATFLQGLVDRGYGWAYRVLDAQYFGVPQRRRRVFVVASLGGRDVAASVLLKPESLCWHPAPRRKKGQGVAADAGAGVEAGLPRTVGTLCADAHPGAYSGQDAYTGRLIPQQKPVVIDRAAFNQGENAQYEPHIEQTDVMDSLVARGPHAVGIPFRKAKRAQSTTDNETCVVADASNTLNNFDLGDTRTTHAVVEPIAFTQNQRDEIRELGDKAGALSSSTGTHQTNYIAQQQVYENHPNDSRITGPLEVAPTVVSRFGTGGGNVPLVNAEPHIVQASELRLKGQINPQDTCPTLLANTKSGDNDPLAVHAITFQPGNLRREAGAEPSTTTTTTLKASMGDQMPHVAIPPMAVRRLTPNECYRLQGFPDNWGNIPWKGKPEGQAPDGPQYKCAGNSMAVPVMRWIGEQIARVEAQAK
jgi:DNA-cytosine methyltransferase